MSLTSTVPASVPSLFQSSVPVPESEAVKKSVPPTAVRAAGDDELFPDTMSLTSTVPSGVPSLRQSSLPVPAWRAENIRVPLTLARLPGEEEPAPGSMSLTSTVPWVVPSLFQSSMPTPMSERSWVKKSVPPTAVRLEGDQQHQVRILTVPAGVPSLFQRLH